MDDLPVGTEILIPVDQAKGLPLDLLEEFSRVTGRLHIWTTDDGVTGIKIVIGDD